MNLLSAHELHSLIKLDKHASEQGPAIEAFFTEENFEALGVPFEDTNEANMAVMQNYLTTADDISFEVRAMITSWIEEGF